VLYGATNIDSALTITTEQIFIGWDPQTGPVYETINHASFELSNINGTNGFRINGSFENEQIGDVNSAGDVDNDGFSDILISSTNLNTSYLIYGNSAFQADFNLSDIDGNNGIKFRDADGADNSSLTTSGDVNMDGYDDLLFGFGAAVVNGKDRAGKTYLVYGNDRSTIQSGMDAEFTYELSELDGSDGLVFNGIDKDDYSGGSVSTAGDFNNDGYDDLLIGARWADPNGTTSGESYIIYGRDSFETLIESVDIAVRRESSLPQPNVSSEFNLSLINSQLQGMSQAMASFRPDSAGGMDGTNTFQEDESQGYITAPSV